MNQTGKAVFQTNITCSFDSFNTQNCLRADVKKKNTVLRLIDYPGNLQKDKYKGIALIQRPNFASN
jgi:hypothetical protein